MKKIAINRLLTYGLLLLLIPGCHCGIPPRHNDNPIGVDTLVTGRDSAVKHRPTPELRDKIPVLRSAVLGYSYFKEMKRKDTKNIHAFISINHPASKVRDTLETLNREDGLENGNDTTSIFTRNMAVFKYVRITLLNAVDSGFQIVQIHDSARQEIDTVNGNHWEWAVTPLTNEKTGVLVLKVIAEKPDGSQEAFETQSIPIKIDLDLDMPRLVWNYMTDNPGIVLTAILIPLIAFFGRKLFTKKKADGA